MITFVYLHKSLFSTLETKLVDYKRKCFSVDTTNRNKFSIAVEALSFAKNLKSGINNEERKSKLKQRGHFDFFKE